MWILFFKTIRFYRTFGNSDQQNDYQVIDDAVLKWNRVISYNIDRLIHFHHRLSKMETSPSETVRNWNVCEFHFCVVAQGPRYCEARGLVMLDKLPCSEKYPFAVLPNNNALGVHYGSREFTFQLA